MANAVAATLSRPVGPLPLWGWAAVAGGAFVVARLLNSPQKAATSTVPFTPVTGGGGGGGSDTPTGVTPTTPVGGPVTQVPSTVIDSIKLYAAEYIGRMKRAMSYTMSWSDKGVRVDRVIQYNIGDIVDVCGGGPKPPPIMRFGSWVCKPLAEVGTTGIVQKNWQWDNSTGVDNTAELERLGLPTTIDIFNNGKTWDFRASMSTQGYGSGQGLTEPVA